MRWHLYCRVVDNFGDIGVAWRLAADLASRGEDVRLAVDDASALAWMAPGGADRVEVCAWSDAARTSPDVVLELFGGALLLLGLFTRPVAFLLAGEMAVAYFQFHAPKGFWPIVNGGMPAVLFSFLWLYFSAAGAGPWSLDALRRETRGASPT